MIDSQKHSDLTKDILEWLFTNRNLPDEICLKVVKDKLLKANLDTETLLHYAAYSFIATDDVFTFRAEGLNKLSELIPLVQTISAESVELGGALKGVEIKEKESDKNKKSREAQTVKQAAHLEELKKFYIASPLLHTMSGASAARNLVTSSINQNADASIKYISTVKLAGHIGRWRLLNAAK